MPDPQTAARPRLYHCAAARSFRCLWALEELGRPYDLVVMPFPPRYAAPEYLEDNPLGTIPLFLDGDVRMTESVAICDYLARKAGSDLAVATDEPGFGDYCDLLSFGEATLTTPQTVSLRYGRFARPGEERPEIDQDYRDVFQNRVTRIADRPADGSEYLAAGRFTMADISVGYALILAGFSGNADALAGPLAAYLDRLKARDGFKRARAAEKAGGQPDAID